MVYKLIFEWKSTEREAHEITIYKFNYNHDEMVRYTKEGNELIVQTFLAIENQYEVLYDLTNGVKRIEV